VIDILLILAGVLLVTASGVLTRYLQQLHEAKKEYEKARDAVKDIILSFNRQFKRTFERLEFVAYKVEASSSRSDRAISKAEEVEKQLQMLENKVADISHEKNQTVTKLDGVDARLRNMAASHEILLTRISSLEEQTKQLSTPSEASVEAVIPMKRDKVLAPLTETELAALELLAAEGPKTAPEIKERIKLSREHTARLMKKLYEEGYVERDPSKIPFKYSVKREMEKLLKRTDSTTT